MTALIGESSCQSWRSSTLGDSINASGDTIMPELEVTALVPKTDTGLLRLATRVKNQRGEVVLEGTHVYLIKKRPR